MPRTTLALTEHVVAQLLSALGDPRESGWMLHCGIADDGPHQDVTICVRAASSIPESECVDRSAGRLEVSSTGFVPAFGLADREGGVAGFAHTHPGGSAAHSALDEELDRELARAADHRRADSAYVSLIIGGTAANPAFAARLHRSDQVREVDTFRVVGSNLDMHVSKAARLPRFDRQMRAWGLNAEDVLAGLRVGVAGAGGTGSAVVEQLVRLGVGEVLVADDDLVEESNLSRLYGSHPGDIGRAKVDVVRENATSISSSTSVEPVRGRVDALPVARRMRHCDVLFGCTDDHAGRSVLARLAYWYLLPLIDTGLVVQRRDDHLEVTGRVTYVAPGAACLICRDRIDPREMATEGLPEDERARLARQGYVSGAEGPAPSVVAYTALVASTAVSELLNRLFIPASSAPTELILQVDKRSSRGNTVPPREGHYCADPSSWGTADERPLLGQLWAED